MRGQAVEAATNAAPVAPGTITGRVTDEMGDGLAGIEVTVYRDQEFRPTYGVATNETGVYAFYGLGPGVYYLRFTDPERHFYNEYYDDVLQRSDAKALVIAGNLLSGIDASLESLNLGGSITGMIKAVTGQAIYRQLMLYQAESGSEIRLVRTLHLAANTNEYQFRTLVPGVYYLCIRTAVYFPNTFEPIETEECYDDVPKTTPIQATPLTVTASQTLRFIDFEIDDRADRALLTGTVTTAVGEPLSGTRVLLYRNDGRDSGGVERQAMSNQHGTFAFYLLDPIPYALTFDDPQAAWLYRGIPLDPMRDHVLLADLSMPNHRQQITATLIPAAQITGVVSFYGVAPPIHGTVHAYTDRGDSGEHRWAARHQTPIDPAGRYTLTGLFSGTYRVRVDALFTGSSASTFYGGNTVESATDIVLAEGEVRRAINWDLGTGIFDSVISGTVTADGAPLAGIRVELWHGYPEGVQFVVYTVTDAQGRYRIEGLPHSQYYLRFADPQQRYAVAYFGDVGVMAISTAVHTDGTNQLANIDGHLVPGGAIHGVVRRYDGTPVANALVGAHFALSQPVAGWAQDEVVFRTDVNGAYMITGLMPGAYRMGFAEASEFLPTAEFYDAANSFQSATDVPVEAGKVTTGIDLILGPDYYLWIPYLAR